MATVIQPTHVPLAMPYQPMRVSVERYHEMIGQGFFAENERFELLDGVIVEKMTKHPPHVIVTAECAERLTGLLPPGWHIRSQDPLTLQRSEPEPDVAVVRGKRSDYARRHPTIGEIPVVVEVAESTLATDRFKAGIYAEAGIPVYWIVNLIERVVEVYSSPKLVEGQNWSYAEQRFYQSGEEIAVSLEDKIIGQINVSDLLP